MKKYKWPFSWERKANPQKSPQHPPDDFCRYLAELQIKSYNLPSDIDNCITCRELKDPETWEKTLQHLLSDDIGFDADEEMVGRDITFNHIGPGKELWLGRNKEETIRKILKKKRDIANGRKRGYNRRIK